MFGCFGTFDMLRTLFPLLQYITSNIVGAFVSSACSISIVSCSFSFGFSTGIGVKCIFFRSFVHWSCCDCVISLVSNCDIISIELSCFIRFVLVGIMLLYLVHVLWVTRMV